MALFDILETAPAGEKLIIDALTIAHREIERHNKIMCAVSGGSDSDILIDLCYRVDEKRKIKYVFLDTGIEFEATKQHIKELEDRYDIQIQRIKPKKPVPICCKEYGVPFLSKQVSEWIERLQKHNFRWEDGNLDDLLKEYPNCRAALRWWCNDFGTEGGKSNFNISHNKWLKEFLIENPPQFSISNKCCLYSKKNPIKEYIKEHNIDLNIYGVRKAEGGARSSAYGSCLTKHNDCDEFRPIFWFLNDTKEKYKNHYQINNSICYSDYRLKRTGCAACPFGRKCFDELEILQRNEPHLFRASNHLFQDSYAYLNEYRNYIDERDI